MKFNLICPKCGSEVFNFKPVSYYQSGKICVLDKASHENDLFECLTCKHKDYLDNLLIKIIR